MLMLKFFKTLWQFSRPHTIIGSIVSLTTLYALACKNEQLWLNLPLLFVVIIAGLACNIYIVGINQIEDIEVDKINKPYLPMASGTLTIKQAKNIVNACIAICLIGSFYVSFFLFLVSIIILFIGWAYSVPPLKLRKHHLPAALCIVAVRGIIVNIGLYLAFSLKINNSWAIPFEIWLLTGFVMVFSLAIAWFKDLPDTTGDAQFNIKTLGILYSPKWVIKIGSSLIILSYITILIVVIFQLQKFSLHEILNETLFTGHLILLIFFIFLIANVKTNNQSSIKRFYQYFWLFFFTEYLVFFGAKVLS